MLHYFATETLVNQQSAEIEKASREAWKFSRESEAGKMMSALRSFAALYYKKRQSMAAACCAAQAQCC